MLTRFFSYRNLFLYEEEPKVVKVREENLQNGMRYLPEESAALAEEICESISLDKDANVFKNIFAPLQNHIILVT